MKTNKHIFWVIVALFFIQCKAWGQVLIGDSAAPKPFSLLEISTQNVNGGVRLPQMTSSQRDLLTGVSGNTTSAPGLLIYNTTDQEIQYWNGVSWTKLNSAWSTTGNAGTTAGTNFIGTTDNQDLVLKRGNSASGRIGTNFVSFGYLALENNIPTSTAIGALALQKNTGIQNTAVGFGALNLNTDGEQNTAVGAAGTLSKNTLGSFNTSIGAGSLADNVTGTHNTSIGSTSLARNISGSNNVAVGNSVLSNSTVGPNTAIGQASLRLNTSGSGNTALGYTSLENALGTNNIAIGSEAARNLTAGDGNIVIGTNVQLPSNSNNRLNIGNLLYGTELTTGTAKVGIGVINPAQKLDIAGNVQFSGTLMPNGLSGTAGQVLTSGGPGSPPIWSAPVAASSANPTVLANLGAGVNIPASTPNATYLYTGTSIDIPANSKYLITITMLIAPDLVLTLGQSIWLRSSFSDSSSSFAFSPDIQGTTVVSGNLLTGASFGVVQGSIIINNNTASTKQYFYWAGSPQTQASPTALLQAFGGSAYPENSIIAIPIN